MQDNGEPDGSEDQTMLCEKPMAEGEEDSFGDVSDGVDTVCGMQWEPEDDA